VHVTLRASAGLPSLRFEHVWVALERAVSRASNGTFRVVHFSAQADHLHLLVEADAPRRLASGMQGLAIRAAKAINRAIGRHGQVWIDTTRALSRRHAKCGTRSSTSCRTGGSTCDPPTGSIHGRRRNGFADGATVGTPCTNPLQLPRRVPGSREGGGSDADSLAGTRVHVDVDWADMPTGFHHGRTLRQHPEQQNELPTPGADLQEKPSVRSIVPEIAAGRQPFESR
jgi:hypothetical protein